jgi:hypothetical protein
MLVKRSDFYKISVGVDTEVVCNYNSFWCIRESRKEKIVCR